MRIGLDGCMPEIYMGEYSTGKRICNDFAVRIPKEEIIKSKILQEAEKCRDVYDQMLAKVYDVEFIGCHKLIVLIGDSLVDTISYYTYLSLDNYDKEKFARIVSKLMLKAVKDEILLSSHRIEVKDMEVYKPMVNLHLDTLVFTKQDLNSLLIDEFKSEDSKLIKLGIQLKPGIKAKTIEFC